MWKNRLALAALLALCLAGTACVSGGGGGPNYVCPGGETVCSIDQVGGIKDVTCIQGQGEGNLTFRCRGAIGFVGDTRCESRGLKQRYRSDIAIRGMSTPNAICKALCGKCPDKWTNKPTNSR